MLYQIYLYNEIPKADLDLKQLVSYLEKTCSFARLEIRENFLVHFHSTELIKGLTDCWITGPPDEERAAYEKGAYLKPETISPGVVYHGWKLLELFQSRIPREEASQNQLHLLLTPRLLLTRDEENRRYHARTVLGGQPSVISSSGLVEGPARSVEYYAFQAGYRMLGQNIPEAVLKKKFSGQFLEYHDHRLTEVIKGYLLQAAAYRFRGEEFCGDPGCRLFNAHYQADMLKAQLQPPEFCSKHQVTFLLEKRKVTQRKP